MIDLERPWQAVLSPRFDLGRPVPLWGCWCLMVIPSSNQTSPNQMEVLVGKTSKWWIFQPCLITGTGGYPHSWYLYPHQDGALFSLLFMLRGLPLAILGFAHRGQLVISLRIVELLMDWWLRCTCCKRC